MTKERKLPLCIDLDGTLIRSDVTQESVLIFLFGFVKGEPF